MGCGIALLGRRGLKPPTILVSKFVPRGLEAWRTWGFEAQQEGSRGAPLKSLRTNFETKVFKFRWFLDLSDQNELYLTPILSKIWDLSDRKFFLLEDLFKWPKISGVGFFVMVWQEHSATLSPAHHPLGPTARLQKKHPLGPLLGCKKNTHWGPLLCTGASKYWLAKEHALGPIKVQKNHCFAKKPPTGSHCFANKLLTGAHWSANNEPTALQRNWYDDHVVKGQLSPGHIYCHIFCDICRPIFRNYAAPKYGKVQFSPEIAISV